MRILVSNIVLSILMLLTILVALQFQDGESILRKNKISVSITNNITDTKLRVHCKDKNIDLGSFKLKYRETYSFSFRPWIIVKAELYFCRFSWLNEFHYFEIYNEVDDYDTCYETCVWKINKSGPCNVRGGDVECFPWNENAVYSSMKIT